MTRELYIEAVKRSPRRFAEEREFAALPPEWISEAWGLQEVQSTVAADFVEEVRKWPPEPFLHASYPLMSVLPPALTPGQVVRLFDQFRERWPMCEPQLREEFEQFFPGCTESFPSPLTVAEVTARLGGDDYDTLLLMRQYHDHPALQQLPGLEDAAGLLQQAIDVGWFSDKEDLSELLTHLEQGNDYGVQESMFEYIAGMLHVSFHDQYAICEPHQMIKHLRGLIASMPA
ncbi:hypothetical protein [Roseimicrobium gellanilyticum]|nr:hypothetical protein [Roseimicrobium gellanilyticum]